MRKDKGMAVSDYVKASVGGLGAYTPGEYRPGYVKLASNENNYGPSPRVVQALREWAAKTQLYPYRSEEVREKIAGYVGVQKENIVLGNGSDELMDMAVKAFIGPVAGSYPSFAEYPLAAGVVGEEYTSVRLQDDFTFSAEHFLDEAGDCNLYFLTSPNNPTGLSIPDDEVRAVAETGKTVILDEAYYEFCGKTRVKWIRKYPNLVVLRTLAKAFALAGLRIGYAVCDPEVADALSKVKPPFNVNSLAEAAAVAALDDLSYMRDCVKKIVAGREKIYGALAGKYKAYASDSNFVFCDVSPMSAQEFFESLLKEKIIVRKFGGLKGYRGEYVRVSAGTKEEDDRFVEALGGL